MPDLTPTSSFPKEGIAQAGALLNIQRFNFPSQTPNQH